MWILLHFALSEILFINVFSSSMSDAISSTLKQWATEYVPFLFVVTLVSYAFGMLLELLLPGFLSQIVDLDLLLWAVILLGVLSVFVRCFKSVE